MLISDYNNTIMNIQLKSSSGYGGNNDDKSNQKSKVYKLQNKVNNQKIQLAAFQTKKCQRKEGSESEGEYSTVKYNSTYNKKHYYLNFQVKTNKKKFAWMVADDLTIGEEAGMGKSHFLIFVWS